MNTNTKNDNILISRLEILRYQRSLINELIDNDKLLYGNEEVLKEYILILDNINNEILDVLKMLREGE
jgi:hypothetical protein